MEEKQSRRRMRPFLEKNMDVIPGLAWHDKKKKAFRISWKNKRNSAWTESDAQIFKSYAIYAGKFEQQGDEEDPTYSTYWKGLFRSALRNSPDTEEIKELRNGRYDKENAYRVYRFLDNDLASSKGKDESKSHANDLEYPSSMDSSSHSQASSTCPRNFLEDFMGSETTVARGESCEQTFDMNNLNVPTVVNDDVSDSSSNEAMNIDALEEFPHDTITIDTCNANAPLQYHQCVSEITPEISPDLMSIETNTLLCPGSTVSESMIIDNTLPTGPDFKSDPSVMIIKVFFGDQCIVSQYFNEKGARLFCGDIALQTQIGFHCGIGIYGPMDMSQMAIPYVDEIRGDLPIDEEQKKIIRKIQSNMNRGLLLGSDMTHIYAKRMCKARAYFISQDGKCKKMDRSDNDQVCVFDLDYFKQQLQIYSTEGSPKSWPSSSVTISFGQDLTADSKIALYAKVTHVEAERLLIKTLENKHTGTGSHLEVFASKSNPDDALADLLEQGLSLNPVQK